MPGRLKSYLKRKILGATRGRQYPGLDFLPSIHSAVCILDARDQQWDDTTEKVQAWLRERHILGSIVYADTMPKSSPVALTPAVQTYSIRDFLFGLLPGGKVRSIAKEEVDLLLCLCTGDSYTIEYVAARSNALVKIGCSALPCGAFDIVVSAPQGQEMSGPEALSNIDNYLKKLK